MLKSLKVWWCLNDNLTIYLFRALDTHDYGKVSRKITHVIALHLSVKKKKKKKTAIVIDNNCRPMGALEFRHIKIKSQGPLQQFIPNQVTHNYPTHVGAWMCNNSSEIFRKKQSVRCV